jgi:hypothetical protein
VAYHDKANVIHIKGFQTRHDQHRIPAYNAIMQQLKDRGIAVTNQVLDIKASEAYKAAITNKWKCTYQLLDLQIYKSAGRIPAKATQHLKAHLGTRLAFLIENEKRETRRQRHVEPKPTAFPGTAINRTSM